MSFKVKLETFEGPIDLLLNLIEDQKLDITQISLAKVADDFIKYTEMAQGFGLENLSKFLEIASKLILIKSKYLLPNLELTEEEQEDIEDLENRLKEYQTFKKIANDLKELSDSDLKSFSRKTKITSEISFFDPPNTNTKELYKIFEEVLNKIPKEEKKEKPKAIVEKSVSIEEKMESLKETLKLKRKFSFKKFLEKAENKTELIVSFLAVLELLKLKVFDFFQEKNFSEIFIISKNHEEKELVNG